MRSNKSTVFTFLLLNDNGLRLQILSSFSEEVGPKNVCADRAHHTTRGTLMFSQSPGAKLISRWNVRRSKVHGVWLGSVGSSNVGVVWHRTLPESNALRVTVGLFPTHSCGHKVSVVTGGREKKKMGISSQVRLMYEAANLILQNGVRGGYYKRKSVLGSSTPQEPSWGDLSNGYGRISLQNPKIFS